MRTRLLMGAGLVGLGAGAAMAVARAQREADALFYDWSEVTLPPPESGMVTTLPVYIHRAETFAGLFAAELGAIADRLPSSTLLPVRLRDGRGVLLVQATRFQEVTDQHVDGPTLVARSYAEVAIAALVTRQPAAPMVPILPFVPRRFAAGVFSLHMAVTTREARDTGRLIGLPKFMADLDFEDDVSSRSVRVYDAGTPILELSTDGISPTVARRQVQSWFSAYEGAMHETAVRMFGYTQFRPGASGARLILGTHQIADELRQLGVATAPVASMAAFGVRAIMPAPHIIGPSRDYVGYEGRDVELGRYTVRHPHMEPVDQYGPVGLAETIASVTARIRPGHAGETAMEEPALASP